jgi:pimeloyl-ACP methyl ester carboxylesterase
VLRKLDGLADFCWLGTAPEQRLSAFERLTLVGGDDLLRAAARVARSFGDVQVPDKFHTIDVAALERAAAFYTQHHFQDRPQTFFVPPDVRPLQVTEQRVHGFHDGEVVDLSFESGYRGQFPGAEALFALHPCNRTVRARLWRHFKGSAGTVIALHGWAMGDLRVNSLALMPGLVYRLGYDVVMPELPFHGRRAGAAEAPTIFPSTDAVLTNEAMAQAIHDLRALRGWLADRGAARIGVLGISLGGYVGSLLAALDEVDFLVAVVPVVSLPDVGWELLRQGPLRAELRSIGLTKERLERVSFLHSPLSHQPKTGAARVMIVAGRGDKVVPAHHPKKLWRHFGEPTMKWFRGGHVAHCLESAAFESILRFLE